MHKAWALPVLLLIAPLAAAHGGPAVLDVELLLLADETDDTSAAFDGYDIVNVHMREAYLEAIDAHGVIFRINLYGDANMPSGESLVRVGFNAAGAPFEFMASTADDAVWTSDQLLLEAIVSSEPYAVNADLQVFVPLAALGITDGDQLDGFWVESQAGGNVVDTAPGGWSLPIVGAPSPTTLLTGEGEVVTASHDIGGPSGYTETVITIEDGAAQVDVQNLITTSGQHVFVRIPETSGWTVAGATGQSLEPGQHPNFTLALESTGTAPQPIHIVSDVGGLETLWLVAEAGAVTVSDEPLAPTDHDADHDTPVLGPAGIILALGALATRRRD